MKKWNVSLTGKWFVMARSFPGLPLRVCSCLSFLTARARRIDPWTATGAASLLFVFVFSDGAGFSAENFRHLQPGDRCKCHCSLLHFVLMLAHCVFSDRWGAMQLAFLCVFSDRRKA